MADFGYTFQPGTGRSNQMQQGGGSGRVDPQEAIRILSFRVPKQPIAGALAPQALLPGAGQQTSQAASLNAIIGTLMKAIQPSRTSTAQMPASMGGGGGMADSGQSNVSFTPGGSAGPVVPQSVRSYQAPTFTPGGDSIDRSMPTPDRDPQTTDLFGNDLTREAIGGTKDEQNTDGSYSDWVRRENVLNDRLPIDFTQDLFRF